MNFIIKFSRQSAFLNLVDEMINESGIYGYSQLEKEVGLNSEYLTLTFSDQFIDRLKTANPDYLNRLENFK